MGRIVEDLKDESEPYRRMVMETVDKVIQDLGTADISARLEELLIDGILYAFQEQVTPSPWSMHKLKALSAVIPSAPMSGSFWPVCLLISRHRQAFSDDESYRQDWSNSRKVAFPIFHALCALPSHTLPIQYLPTLSTYTPPAFQLVVVGDIEGRRHLLYRYLMMPMSF